MANNGELARLPLGIPLEQRLKVSFRPGNGKSFNLRGGLLFGVRIFSECPKNCHIRHDVAPLSTPGD